MTGNEAGVLGGHIIYTKMDETVRNMARSVTVSNQTPSDPHLALLISRKHNVTAIKSCFLKNRDTAGLCCWHVWH